MNTVGFANHRTIKNPRIAIQTKDIDGEIEILYNDEIRFGNSILNIDKHYIVELITDGGSKIRISGPAGRKNLEYYKESLI